MQSVVGCRAFVRPPPPNPAAVWLSRVNKPKPLPSSLRRMPHKRWLLSPCSLLRCSGVPTSPLPEPRLQIQIQTTRPPPPPRFLEPRFLGPSDFFYRTRVKSSQRPARGPSVGASWNSTQSSVCRMPAMRLGHGVGDRTATQKRSAIPR